MQVQLHLDMLVDWLEQDSCILEQVQVRMMPVLEQVQVRRYWTPLERRCWTPQEHRCWILQEHRLLTQQVHMWQV